MCVAIYKPAGMKLDEDTIFKCYLANSDGCGFAYVKEEELIIYKTMEYAKFLEEFTQVQDSLPDSPMLIHFRIATHGTVDEHNCHPFQIDEEHVFIHNGVLRNVPDCKEKKKSDTQVFNELVLQNLPAGWFYSAGIKVVLEDFIGFSKMVILNRKGEALILNESKGNWIDGVWFSNDLWDKSYSGYNSLLGDGYAYGWCWNCGKDMGIGGGYKKGSRYCSSKCEREDKAENTCSNCGSGYAYMSTQVGNTGPYYSYCSWKCRDDHSIKILEERRKKQKENNTSTIYVQCLYCAKHSPIAESFEITFDCESVEQGYIKDYICIDCIDEAIKSGLIEESEELLEAACTILTEKQGGKL